MSWLKLLVLDLAALYYNLKLSDMLSLPCDKITLLCYHLLGGLVGQDGEGGCVSGMF